MASTQLMEVLLARGADLLHSDKDGQTAFMWAVSLDPKP